MPKGDIPALIKEARERWTRAAEAEDAQRKMVLECKKFQAGDQWAPEIKIQRSGGQAVQGQAAQPPRPCLTIDRLSPSVRIIVNGIRQANFGLDVLPNGFGADDDTARIYKGILRRMQNQARAEGPIEWAAQDAAVGGLGWVRLRTDWVNQEPTDTEFGQMGQAQLVGEGYFDQEVKLERITNCLSVYCDPAATGPTKQEALYMFVTEDMSRDDFKTRWPKAKLSDLQDFASTGDQGKWASWVAANTIRVAEYWRIEYEDGPTYCLMADGSMQVKTEGMDEAQIRQSRPTKRKLVKMSIISATEELEQHDWPGTRIPIFPLLGEELNIDGKVKYRGIIEEGMDPQRMVNFFYSGAAETVALAPKSPFIAEESQVAPYKDMWQSANTKNFATLVYRAQTPGGHLLPPPQRETSEPPIQAMVLMLQKSEDAIKATTSIYDPGLGNTNPREKSGRAILALQNQGELSNSNYADNVSRLLVEIGNECLAVLPKITRQGQILQILGIDDKPEQVMIGQPFSVNEQGIPQPAPHFQEGLTKFYDLNKGRYAVTVSVNKDYPTARAEGAQMLGDLIEKNPGLMQVFGDLFFRDLNFPGAQEVAERMKKMIDPKLLAGADGKGPSPEQLEAELQRVTQLLQLATQELQEKTRIIETEQVKAQQELEKVQLQEWSKTQQAQLSAQQAEQDAQVKLQIATIQAEATIGSAEIKAQLESAKTEIANLRALFEQAAGFQHDAQMQASQQEHEASVGEAQRAHEQAMSEQQGQQTLDQQAQAAALAPQPQGGEE